MLVSEAPSDVSNSASGVYEKVPLLLAIRALSVALLTERRVGDCPSSGSKSFSSSRLLRSIGAVLAISNASSSATGELSGGRTGSGSGAGWLSTGSACTTGSTVVVGVSNVVKLLSGPVSTLLPEVSMVCKELLESV